MKLCACVCFYRDGVKMLERCLKSLKKNGVDITIAVDGAYKEFPVNNIKERGHKRHGSTPEELKFLNDNLHEYIDMIYSALPGGWTSQMEKRNKSIELVHSGSYFLVIDADEELITGIDKSKLTLDAYSVQMYEPLTGKSYPSNRIFKKYRDLEYRNRHCALYRTSKIKDPKDVYSGLVSRDLSIPFTTPLVSIFHYPSERSNERQLAGAIYKENRTSEIPVKLRGKKDYERNKV